MPLHPFSQTSTTTPKFSFTISLLQTGQFIRVSFIALWNLAQEVSDYYCVIGWIYQQP